MAPFEARPVVKMVSLCAGVEACGLVLETAHCRSSSEFESVAGWTPVAVQCEAHMSAETANDCASEEEQSWKRSAESRFAGRALARSIAEAGASDGLPELGSQGVIGIRRVGWSCCPARRSAWRCLPSSPFPIRAVVVAGEE